jgi:hypothetical protein
MFSNDKGRRAFAINGTGPIRSQGTINGKKIPAGALRGAHEGRRPIDSVAERHAKTARRRERHDRIHSDMTKIPRDPFGPLGTLLGYVIAIAATAMLVYTVSRAIHPSLWG